ncbi:MAG: prenyltransferase/squalene oxidase repeat-containing protein, partial [Planctomycetia bacterium]
MSGRRRFFTRRLAPHLAALLLLGTVVPEAAVAQTPEQVNASIDRGVAFLKRKQLQGGSWEDVGEYRGGVTALCALALLSCDVPPDDPKLQKSLDFLRGVGNQSTYVVALQVMALAAAHPERDALLIRQKAEWLKRTRLNDGGWSYGDQNSGFSDNSNTQYALLGLDAAAQAGVAVDDAFWEKCRANWLANQERSVGSWGYRGKGSTASMTVAGVSSLVITSRQLEAVRPGTVGGKRVRCAGAREDANLRAGVNWLGRNFHVDGNAGGHNTWLYYYLYGLERAGRLTGRRFLADHDWYREGTRFILKKQQQNGAWSANGGGADEDVNAQYNTAFALLFLSKGKIPILVNKLEFGDEDWNNAPNDCHNLTEFLAKAWKRKLNWQVVDVSVAKVEDLLQAPVLHLSGHKPPKFTGREKKLLRDYVEQGGMIVADANCGVPGFDAGF